MATLVGSETWPPRSFNPFKNVSQLSQTRVETGVVFDPCFHCCGSRIWGKTKCDLSFNWNKICTILNNNNKKNKNKNSKTVLSWEADRQIWAAGMFCWWLLWTTLDAWYSPHVSVYHFQSAHSFTSFRWFHTQESTGKRCDFFLSMPSFAVVETEAPRN